MVDIGPGCSDLPVMLIDLCMSNSHQLHLIDSVEMLNLLPSYSDVYKIAALYPNCPEFTNKFRAKVDIILCYSVLHYVMLDVAFSASLMTPYHCLLLAVKC